MGRDVGAGAVANPQWRPAAGWQSGHTLLLQMDMRSKPPRPLSASERATRLQAVGELVGSLKAAPRARTAPRKTPKRSTQAEREAAARRILGPRRAAYMLDRGSRW
ncbi:hypothetical protein P1P68_22215 [Streptomyces scabiei]|uniref:hypothetical protein n=1 Tax=Streptomyces scabiei TaxID=1930 RepID=UPI0029906A77|nr:hypothetical protein [Streptomyces scabiei]MDW8807425.1 hypothetical protein [Streptomyces scabiei]